MSSTPELDKQNEILASGESGHVGEFLDWLHEDQGLRFVRSVTHEVEIPCSGPRGILGNVTCEGGKLRRFGPMNEDEGTCPKCEGTGWVTETRTEDLDDSRSNLKLIADYFGIDLVKIEAERAQLLESLRSGTPA